MRLFLGDIQINDTDMHAPLKKRYRLLEAELMLKQLEEDPGKIPRPSKDDMMSILNSAWTETLNEVDVVDRFKCLWLTNDLNGSEDYLVSQRIKDDSLLEFCTNLLKQEPPKTLKALIRTITPPKGVKRKQIEGEELYDCEGEELELEEDDNAVLSDSEDEVAEVDGTGAEGSNDAEDTSGEAEQYQVMEEETSETCGASTS